LGCDRPLEKHWFIALDEIYFPSKQIYLFISPKQNLPCTVSDMNQYQIELQACESKSNREI